MKGTALEAAFADQIDNCVDLAKGTSKLALVHFRQPTGIDSRRERCSCLRIGELLVQHRTQNEAVRADDFLNLLLRSNAAGSNAPKPVRRGTSAYIVADREHARRGENRQQTRLFEIDTPLLVDTNTAEYRKRRRALPRNFGHQLEKVRRVM